MASTLPVSPYCSAAFEASAAGLSQFQFVTFTSSGQIETPSSSGVYCWVLYDSPSLSGATVQNDLATGGYVVGAYYTCVNPAMTGCKVISGGTLTIGEAITTNTNGEAVAQSGTGLVLGYALAAVSAGDLVPIAP